MKIYTSYFGNAKALHEADIVIIGIALYPPRWMHCPSLKQVAPTHSILKYTHSEDEYTMRYESEVLPFVDMDDFVKQLEQIGGGKDVALCCYEKPNEFCHRQLLAKYMNSLGYEVKEFEEAKKSRQLDMFAQMEEK